MNKVHCMKVKCQKCQKVFDTDKKQTKILEQAISEGKKKLIFMECPICFKDSYVDPFNLLDEKRSFEESNKIINCPICHDGIVSYIDNGDEKFWGCGECGNVWFTKKDLNKAISNSK